MDDRAAGSCPYCGGGLEPHWPRIAFHRCAGCGLVLKQPLPSEAELQALYTASWQAPESHQADTGATDAAIAAQFTGLLAAALGRRDFAGLRVLDFGAGGGALTRALGAEGAVAVALDPYSAPRLRAEGVAAVASLAELDPAPFDGICALEVVEHLREPWVFLGQLHRRLVPGGWLLVTTPNPEGLNARLTGGRWREAVKDGHILFMGSATLRRMLLQAGFARVERPHWRIRFAVDPLTRAYQEALQALRLDGGLRLLAFR